MDEVRDSYDSVAADYVEHVAGELEHKPFDRAYLDRLATELQGKGPVAELGCGPGHVGRYLSDRGVDISGLDLSPAMIEEARRLNPGMQFVVGDMLDLPYADGSLAALVSFYSIIHFESDQLDQSIREFRRVLEPGGLAAVAFHIGDGITVNAILPGPIENDRNLHDDPEYAERWASILPVGRVGQPSDVAALARFLASDEASFITGSAFSVDGGLNGMAVAPDLAVGGRVASAGLPPAP